jgi:hypothetical protein
MAIRFDLAGNSPVRRYVCPRCGGGKFELLPLGIPGTGASVCLNCRLSIATWAHEKPLNTVSALVTT